MPSLTARPCSTPHSAPLSWLKACPDDATAKPPSIDPEADPEHPLPATLSEDRLDEIAEILRGDPAALTEIASRLSPDQERKDGWSPFSRRLFLDVLADTGRVSTACEYTQMTRQSAYALRARAPLFAAGWDAACEIARAPLADALYEMALDRTTDTITKDGKVVATRHRFDSRLSIAVLNRLDKRCDRAAELGANHLAVVRNWDEWLGHLGRGDDAAAQIILETPLPETAPDSTQQCQARQLPLGANPTPADQDDTPDPAPTLFDRCWKEEPDGWLTDLPPPADLTGIETGEWGERSYKRDCTAEESTLLEADEALQQAADRADDAALRDTWFAMLKEELAEAASAPCAGEVADA